MQKVYVCIICKTEAVLCPLILKIFIGNAHESLNAPCQQYIKYQPFMTLY